MGNEIPIVACFGNEEKQGIREDIVRLVGHRVKFLEEMTFRVDIGEDRVGIVRASPVVVNPVISDDGGSTLFVRLSRNVQNVYQGCLARSQTLPHTRSSWYTIALSSKQRMRVILIHSPGACPRLWKLPNRT